MIKSEKNNNQILFLCIQNFVMCIIISLSIGILLDNNKIMEVVTSTIISWCINMGFDLVFPVETIANFLSGKIHRGKTLKYLLKVFVISTLNVSFILCVMLLLKVGINNIFLMLMRKTWFPLIIIAYIGAVISTPISIKLSEVIKKITCQK